jgi:hypothetical protein
MSRGSAGDAGPFYMHRRVRKIAADGSMRLARRAGGIKKILDIYPGRVYSIYHQGVYRR